MMAANLPTDTEIVIPEPTPLRQRWGLVLGPVIFALLLFAPPPPGMSDAAWTTAAVAALMVVWWISEAVPIPATALLPLILFPALDVLPIAGAAAPYANPVIFLFLGGFLIAIALERCGLHRRMALTIIRAVGTRPANLIAGFMIATAFLSMWVSNTATVLMMLPMALSVITLFEDEQRRSGFSEPNFAPALLLGVAYASSIGGTGTLIGTPPNALLAGFMSETYGVQIGFLQWMLVGVPLVIVALPLTWLLLIRVLHPVSRGAFAGGREAIQREAAALGGVRRGEVIVGTITALTATAWITSPLLERIVPGISDAGIAVTGGLLLFAIPISWRRAEFPLTWKQAERLPWAVLLLFGGGLSLARAVHETGLAAWLGRSFGDLGGVPILLVVLGITALVVFITELMSNTATAATFLPVAAALAIGIGAEPLLFALPAVLAASCGFMLPVGTPPNAIVYASERLTILQMARAGFLVNLLLIVLITAVTFGLAVRVFGIGQ
jgi:sodium-dependent dicarboxylate transporter 2/3/5